MRKAKTIIASLIVMLTSIFVSACSCGDSGGASQIYVTDIDIRCVENMSSETIEVTPGEILKIACHVGDTISLEYKLTPIDATVTQVNWEFENHNKIVQPKIRNEWYRSKSTTEVVEFEAVGRTESNYTTTLIFTANITDNATSDSFKKAFCEFIVYEDASKLSSFTAPKQSNFKFDNKTNTITWNPVAQVITPEGVTTNATIGENNFPLGLTGYEIVKTNLDTGLTITDKVGVNVNSYDKFEDGVNYDVKIRAVGDGNYAMSSEYSDSFKFYKLKEATELSNNNGIVTFVTPEHSSLNDLHYYYDNADPAINQSKIGIAALPKSQVQRYLNSNDLYNYGKKYCLSVVSYPDGYNSSKGYSEKDGVKYYPSTPKTSLYVQRLTAPTINLQDTRKPITIAGVEFTNMNESLRPHGATMIVWGVNDGSGNPILYESQYNQAYSYEISGGDLQSPITGNTADLSYTLGSLAANKSYKVKVKTIGNNANTISSDFTEMNFNVVEHLQVGNITLSDDIITNHTSLKTGGVELFFVYQGSNPSTNSKRVELTGEESQDNYNISKIGLVAGEYKVYGKNICLIDQYVKNAVVEPTNGQYSELMTITVASKVQEARVTRDGYITFNKVDGITEYKINIESSSDVSFTVDVYEPLEPGVVDEGEVYYTISGNKISVSIEDVFRHFLKSNQEVQESDNPVQKLEEILLRYLHSDNIFSCNIQSKGYSEGSLTVVSSTPTESIQFSRAVSITGVSLENYKLYFDRVGTSNQQAYVLTLQTTDPTSGDIVNSYVFKHSGMWTIDNKTGKVVTDLTKDEVVGVGGVNKTFAELIDPSKNNYVLISALGFDGNSNSDAVLNSTPCRVKYAVTDMPTNLVLDQNGNLDWQTILLTSDSLDNYKYAIKFYKVSLDGDTETLTALPAEELKVAGSMVGSSVTGQDEAGNSITQYTLRVNVGDVLAKYPDEVIALTVEETHASMYTGFPSSTFYATRISAPELQYTIDENKQLITWAAINNADNYYVSVKKLNDETFEYENDCGTVTYFSIYDRINDNTNPWTEGTYTISVVAGSNFAGSSTAKAPYVMTSITSNITITIVNGSLDVLVKGNTITWNNICYGSNIKANYKVSFTKSDSSTGSITNQDLMIYSADMYKITLEVSEFTAGVNKVVIEPTLDFEETGFIIIGALKTNSVTKWGKATNLTTTGGNLTFRVYGATDTDRTSLDFELYQTEGQTDSLVSENLYNILTPVLVEESERYLLYTVVLDGLSEGSLTLKVRIKSEGKLNSELSDAVTATKIATVADLSKSGDWLTWTAQAGISSYEIAYRHVNDAEFSKILLQVEEQGDGSYKTLILKEGSTNEYVEDTAKQTFYYESGKFYYKFDYSLIIADKTGDFLLAIRPLTEEAGYFSGNTSVPVTITKLNNATAITVEEGKIHIADYVADGSQTPTTYILTIYQLTTKVVSDPEGDKIEIVRATDAQGNEIKYVINESYNINESSSNIAPIDLNTIGFVTAGDYEIELTYIGNGNEVIDSNTINNNTLDKLDVTSLSTQDGQVVWENAQGATSYTLEINDGSNTTLIDIQSGVEQTVLTEDQLIYTTKVSNGVDETTGEETFTTQTNKYALQPGKLYTLRIKSNANGKIHSNWSQAFAVKKLYSPTAVTVSRNTSEFTVKQEVTTESGGTVTTTWKDVVVQTGSPIVTWNNANVTNLSLDYQLKYGELEIVNIKNPTSLKYAIDPSLPIAVYPLSIRVIGNDSTGSSTIGLLTSDYSTSVSLNYIQDVQGPEVNNGTISWDEVNGAFSYKVTATANDAANTSFVAYTATNSIKFSKFAFANLNEYYGNYSFVINAITDPTTSIVSTNAAIQQTNTVSLFKPQVLENFRVKDGMLNWRVAIADIKTFVEAQDGLKVEGEDLTLEVIKYVLNRINNGVSDNADLENQISHLLRVRFNINNVEVVDTPTTAIIIDVDGEDENIVSNESEYLTAEYIEYSYNIGIDPEIDENTQDNGASPTTYSTRSTDVEYVAGRYVIKISPMGNSNIAAPVVDGGFTQELEAYKPSTPKTWETRNSDIYYGRVQWGLCTTPDTTLNNFVYYDDYRITAVPVEGEGSAYTDISVKDTYNAQTSTNTNLTNNYQYYRDVKNDLFVPVGGGATGTNLVNYNTFYRLLINTIGTKDSNQLAAGETIYLNSNACVVGAPVNILSTTTDIQVKQQNGSDENMLSWNTAFGSTYTKVYIYGPFDNLNNNKDARNEDWVEDKTSENILNLIDQVYAGEKPAISAEKIEEYSKMLRIIDFAEVNGVRVNTYTMTDAIYNDETFAAGGYILKFQEMGDNMGVIDSNISTGYPVEKLATPTSQSPGWVGNSTSNIYVWNPSNDKWQTKEHNNATGTFVWSPVPGATAYKVELFRMLEGDTNATSLITIYTRETQYDPESADERFNEINYKYFIRITAIRSTADNIGERVDNFFSSDYQDTTQHFRLAVPNNVTIYGNGKIEWNNGVEYDNIGSFRIQFNYGNYVETKDALGSVSSVPELELGAGGQNGTIMIAVKSIAVSYLDTTNAYLNSVYSYPAIQVTRLADPDARVVEGIFNWGTGSDPLTASELTIDDNDTEIISKDTGISSYKLFTDITTHNKGYLHTNDITTYPIGTHTFKIKFQGSGGTTGVNASGSTEDFFIASNEKVLTAYKLETPEVENVTMDLASTAENMVKWSPITNAQGYRVRIFSSKQESYIASIDITTEALLNILHDNPTHDNAQFFMVDGLDITINTIYFKLNSIIEQTGLISSGGSLYVYVQALGSGIETDAYPELDENKIQTNDLYISSSYSTFTTVAVPPAPANLDVNENGVVTWSIDSEDVFGVKLGTEYVVSNVSADDFESYWRKTSHYLGEQGQGIEENTVEFAPNDELISRTTVYSVNNIDGTLIYTLKVIDILYLPPEEVWEKNDFSGNLECVGNKTPTSYQLTTIAEEYNFTLTALSFNPEEVQDNEFASSTIEFNKMYNFDSFGKGDGSSLYKYTVADYTQLDKVRYFTDREFVLTNDIDLYDSSSLTPQNYWTPITDEFTGVIDGADYSIKHFCVSSTIIEKAAIYALMFNNNGTIRNLTIEVNIEDTINHSGGLSAATIAIYNKGSINNVVVTGTINISAKTISSADIGTSVGGLVVENSGTISNSAVHANITALDDSTSSVLAGGIAKANKANATIENTCFKGTIRSNYLGGIVATNAGTINKCYVDDAEIYVTDRATTVTNIKKGAAAGGIAGEIQGSGKVKNSYSIANIYVSKQDASGITMTIGGLVAHIGSSLSIDISNNYVVRRIAPEAGVQVVTNGLFVYDMIHGQSSAQLSNNYYIVEEVIREDADVSLDSSNEVDIANVIDKVGSLDDLKNILDQNIYDTNTEYPTLKFSN